MSEAEPVQGEVVEPSTAVAERPEAPPLPEGVLPSPNYMKAIELGHVLAASRLYPGVHDPAKAAVRVMIGMDIGVSPTAALQGIHMWEKDGKLNIIIEGKLLASIIKQRAGYDYAIVKRTATECVLRFMRNGEPVNSDEGLSGPDVSFTMEDAEKAGLKQGKGQMYLKYPEEMLYWRCMAKGTRIHFPELLSGQPVYVAEEMGEDEESLKKALEPGRPAPLADEKAEDLRAQARARYDELKAINPERVPPGRFASMVSNAEHSHEQLENLVEALGGLVESEQRVAALAEEIKPLVPAAAHKTLLERVERKGSNQERIEALEEALAQAKGESTTEEDENGSSDEPRG